MRGNIWYPARWACALVVAATLIPGAGAYLAYATLQKALGVVLAGLTLYLSPLCATAVAAIFLGEAAVHITCWAPA